MKTLILAAIRCSLIFIVPTVTYAISAEWGLDPISGDWNTAANWTPMGIPNAPADTATFARSNTTSVFISANTEVDGITFTPAAASSYTITASPGFKLTLSGTGITNDSGITQNFVTAVDERVTPEKYALPIARPLEVRPFLPITAPQSLSRKPHSPRSPVIRRQAAVHLPTTAAPWSLAHEGETRPSSVNRPQAAVHLPTTPPRSLEHLGEYVLLRSIDRRQRIPLPTTAARGLSTAASRRSSVIRPQALVPLLTTVALWFPDPLASGVIRARLVAHLSTTADSRSSTIDRTQALAPLRTTGPRLAVATDSRRSSIPRAQKVAHLSITAVRPLACSGDIQVSKTAPPPISQR